MCPGVCITEQKHVFKENTLISSIIFFYTKSSRILHVSDNIPFNLTVSVLPCRLSTKLKRLMNNRDRMEQLAAGTAPSSRVRDVEMEEMMEELHEKVRALQAENEGLKQRLLVSKHQLINSQSQRPTPYDRIQPRVNTGLKKFRDNTSSPSLIRPKSEFFRASLHHAPRTACFLSLCLTFTIFPL